MDKTNELQMRAADEMNMLEVNAINEQMENMTKPKIGEKEILEATEILRKYKEGKARLEQKIVANEEFWKLRQWKYFEKKDEDFAPSTAWLWSCIQSRYSDAMDSYPTCNFLPRQEDDKEEAERLSNIVPVVLEQNRYEETYSDIAWYMLKHGGCVQKVSWDGTKHNGLGDISVTKVDFINLFWEPGITDLQKSENVFHTELVSKKILEQRYPQCEGKLNSKAFETAKYLYDDSVDITDKIVVVDWYYHTEYNGRKVLQFCKFVNDIVLYATENEIKTPTKTVMDEETGIPMVVPIGEPMATRGLYDHALYPFVAQALYPIEGSICGYGLTDIGRDCQMQIDRLNKAITDNAVAGASPRYFTKGDGTINEEEFLDNTKPFVHVSGNLSEEYLRPIDVSTLPSIYVNVLDSKVNELKYVTSNQDSNNGVAPSGVTAASAIAALQETAGKNARSSNKTFHRAYREVVYQIVELIRQFYDAPRTFRIASENSGEQFVMFSNEGLKPQQMINNGVDMGLRVPEFDIEVTTEKASPYKKIEQNELALNFYQQGFFNPQMADQALACLDMMDFSHKEDVMKKISENQTLMMRMVQYQQMALQLAQQTDPLLAQQIANQILADGGQTVPMGGGEIDLNPSGESKQMERARSQALESTQVG